MKAYDSNKPLIHIHIPKTGGVSVREIYKKWFNDGLLLNYYNEIDGKMPHKYNLETFHERKKAICVYGHFNKKRNFGIKHYYPEVDQFITILRDPFEKAVSGYFYLKKNSVNWKNQPRMLKAELKDYLLRKNFGMGMFNHFPTEVTMDNFKEVIETYFIEIGVLEYLDESMKRIASKLNCKYESSYLQLLNVSKRDQIIPHEYRELFYEKNPLFYAVYNYVLANYTQNASPNGNSAALQRSR